MSEVSEVSEVDALVYEPPTDYDPYEAPEVTIDTDPKVLREVAGDERFYTKALRGPGDVIVSGPIWNGWGPGRYFKRRLYAYVWLRAKYGPDRVVPLDRQTSGRWAYLVKGLRKETDKANAS